MSRNFRLTLPEPPEREIQEAVLRFLAIDRRVAWHQRFNTGATLIESRDAYGKPKRRFVRFAFPGCSDILGQLVTGHFLAVEIKRPSAKPTPDQISFLAQVEAAGGLALIARSIDDVKLALDLFGPLGKQSAA